MTRSILFYITFLLSLGTFAQGQISNILPLQEEKWYGVYTAKAFLNTPIKDITFQPYSYNERLNNLNVDNRGNQAAPLLISNKGRYVWSNNPFAFEFKNGTLIVHSDEGKINAITAGNTLREAYLGAMKLHFPALGKMPNELMFKMPQYNMWIELNFNQNQTKILKYANDIIANDFPSGVFMIDDIWSKDYGNFDFDPSKFSDPKSMVDELHTKGFKVMLWLTPFVSPDGKEFGHLSKNKAIVLRKDSSKPAIIKWWNGYSGCLDFTKPFAVDWLRTKLKALQNTYGIDGFKFDAVDFDFYSSGSPVFPNEDTNTNGPIQAELFGKLGAEFEFNEFRAGWKNGNQPLAQRLQDKGYSWDELKILIPDMLSAGLIGHPYTCPDMIGGGLLSTFENIDYSKFDQELMVRSAQMQALMPMMQFSVAPWRVLDEKHLKIVRQAAKLHASMGDYIVSLAKKASLSGEPIVRHLEYAFPNQGFTSCDTQYMLGDEYLVCPMIEKGFKRTVKLPKGKWIDELGKKYKGGQTITIDVPLNRLPYFKISK